MKAVPMNEEQGGLGKLGVLPHNSDDDIDWDSYDNWWYTEKERVNFWGRIVAKAISMKLGSGGDNSSGGNGGSTNATGINMNGLLETSPETVLAIVMDLSYITGLNIWINAQGYMQYNIPKGQLKGSATARNFLISAIENPDETVKMKEGDYCYVNMDSKSISVQNTIEWNSEEVVANICGMSSDLNFRTNGFGMFFIHELGHTRVGGKKEDDAKDGYTRGENINFTNRIRSELSAFYKSNFGEEQRHASYKIVSDLGYEYYPYSVRAREMLEEQQKPSGQYIRIKGL